MAGAGEDAAARRRTRTALGSRAVTASACSGKRARCSCASDSHGGLTRKFHRDSDIPRSGPGPLGHFGTDASRVHLPVQPGTASALAPAEGRGPKAELRLRLPVRPCTIKGFTKVLANLNESKLSSTP